MSALVCPSSTHLAAHGGHFVQGCGSLEPSVTGIRNYVTQKQFILAGNVCTCVCGGGGMHDRLTLIHIYMKNVALTSVARSFTI